jgi:Phosphodiester glycosidase
MRMKEKIYQFGTVIIVLGLVNVALAQKKTFSLDDILGLPTVGEVAIAPKGDWVVYTLSELDFEHNATNLNISLASTAVQNPVTRRLTNGTAQNTNLQWAPDGKWFKRWLSDSTATETIAPGVTRRFIVKAAGPWRINVLEIDLRQPGLEIASARAYDRFLGREKTSSMAARHSDSLNQVIAALNADFFNLKTGEIENNHIIAGEFVKGVKITGSPFDTFDNIHSQFAMSFDGRPFIERFAFNGKIIWRDGSMSDLSSVNAVPDSNALVIFNHYYGTSSPRDSLQWGVTEIELAKLTEKQDTLIYRAQKNLLQSSGTVIPRNGLILAGYHDAQKLLAHKLTVGDTVKMILGLSPSRRRIKTLVGGWPRIVVNGRNTAARVDSIEGTFPRFSVNRHPRSGVGFSADSTKLYFVTVDGRQETDAGMSLVEFADLMISLGIHQGLNMDGGGSTTLVVNGKVVNSPSDKTGERAVGNCLLLLLRGSSKR